MFFESLYVRGALASAVTSCGSAHLRWSSSTLANWRSSLDRSSRAFLCSAISSAVRLADGLLDPELVSLLVAISVILVQAQIQSSPG